jgi:hypothetical protein
MPIFRDFFVIFLNFGAGKKNSLLLGLAGITALTLRTEGS